MEAEGKAVSQRKSRWGEPTRHALTELQAYDAMVAFVEAYWRRGNRTSDDIAVLLSNISRDFMWANRQTGRSRPMGRLARRNRSGDETVWHFKLRHYRCHPPRALSRACMRPAPGCGTHSGTGAA